MSVDPAIPAGGAEVGRRTIILLMGVLVLGAPALILRLTCAGHSCDEPTKATATIPFCSLPEDLRAGVAAGFRDGRSPEVFGIAGTTPVAGGTAAPRVAWPSIAPGDTAVPLVFTGSSLVGPSLLPDGARLDQVAPTIAAAIELDRPHPEVRSGTALPLEITDRPTLVVEVVLKGVGSEVSGTGTMPILDDLIENGAATTHADPGSVPLDSAAVLTTIGTGGLPSQHGITGSLIRNDAGTLVRAWSESAPPSVIATLGDDLDELRDGTPRIGLVAPRTDARGLIGGMWYLGAPDDDDVVVTRDAAAATATDLLVRGYGSDEATDLLGVVLTGSPSMMDRALGEIVEAASEASEDRLLIVVTATGRAERATGAVPWTRVSEDLDATIGAPVTEAVVPGGIFIDQAVIAREQITERQITNALLQMEAGEDRMLADAFPAIAISFLRYC